MSIVPTDIVYIKTSANTDNVVKVLSRYSKRGYWLVTSVPYYVENKVGLYFQKRKDD